MGLGVDSDDESRSISPRAASRAASKAASRAASKVASKVLNDAKRTHARDTTNRRLGTALARQVNGMPRLAMEADLAPAKKATTQDRTAFSRNADKHQGLPKTKLAKAKKPSQATTAKVTPAKFTPAKAAPARGTVAKRTGAKETAAKVSPAKDTVPIKAAPVSAAKIARSGPVKSAQDKSVQTRAIQVRSAQIRSVQPKAQTALHESNQKANTAPSSVVGKKTQMRRRPWEQIHEENSSSPSEVSSCDDGSLLSQGLGGHRSHSLVLMLSEEEKKESDPTISGRVPTEQSSEHAFEAAKGVVRSGDVRSAAAAGRRGARYKRQRTRQMIDAGKRLRDSPLDSDQLDSPPDPLGAKGLDSYRSESESVGGDCDRVAQGGCETPGFESDGPADQGSSEREGSEADGRSDERDDADGRSDERDGADVRSNERSSVSERSPVAEGESFFPSSSLDKWEAAPFAGLQSVSGTGDEGRLGGAVVDGCVARFNEQVRATEMAEIRRFVEENRRGRRPCGNLSGRVMIVEGTTGTGKTSTIDCLLTKYGEWGWRTAKVHGRSESGKLEDIIETLVATYSQGNRPVWTPAKVGSIMKTVFSRPHKVDSRRFTFGAGAGAISAGAISAGENGGIENGGIGNGGIENGGIENGGPENGGDGGIGNGGPENGGLGNSGLLRLSELMESGCSLIIFVDEMDMLDRLSKNYYHSENCLRQLLYLCEAHLHNALLIGATNDPGFIACLSRKYSVERIRSVKFDHYTYEQMVSIIKSINQNVNTDNAGLQYGIRKIASQKGDFRQILDLLFRADETETTFKTTKSSKSSSFAEATTSATSTVTHDQFNVYNKTSTKLVDHGLVEGESSGPGTALNELAKIQDLLGKEYKTDIMRVVDTIQEIPILYQEISASIMIIVNKNRSHMNLDINSIYNLYRDMCSQMGNEYVPLSSFENCLTVLQMQQIVKNLTLCTPMTSSVRKRSRTPAGKTPMSRSRPPILKAIDNAGKVDFVLNARQAAVAFNKLKAKRVCGFTLLSISDEYFDD
ncbi:hypothetical protein GNI_093230 [Gregarina niphandrodes]|uniref:AAA+ ATPase domain-containing protein n=1 Tax=Gregarina niphandrodes TaxID=110365 RepID=A0A023B595_GRENI|nr:hypothetical protein GNI_093230 [Gregarina niphandrodes]EZG59053.1 hypothetical protein GNI_093230 [Gregarina niphandrodes]|eukprot:XP_011130919.1 hypothetical protein GNI_093230 [Gregarina niphandrodes]